MPRSKTIEDAARWPWWYILLDKTNKIVITLTGSFLLYTRSAGVAWFTIGAIFCSLSVKVLKRFVRQPRPVIVNGRRKKTYGMPSTHSAAMAFFATYITLACVYLPIHPSLPSSPAISRVLPPLVILPLSTTIAASRIWLGHHTLPQVAVGLGYGMLFAPLWLSLWTGGINEYGPEVERLVQMYSPI